MNGYGQNDNNSFQPWNLTSISGAVRIKGNYREQNEAINNFSDFSKNSFFTGGVLLNTRSSVWHPNFLLLDVGGEFNPGTNQQKYIVSPDRSEVLTSKKIDLRATFFSKKVMSLSGFVNYSQNFVNREHLTNIKTNRKQWGASYSFRNKFLPLSINYSNRKWNQKETLTGRITKNDHKSFHGRISKSFPNGGNHELVYSHNNYLNEDYNSVLTINRIDNIYLNNSIFLDPQQNYLFRSRISNLNQKGAIDYSRLQVLEDVSLSLPNDFNLSGNYNYSKFHQEFQEYDQHNVTGRLGHELFLSLSTNVFYQYNSTVHSVFQETNNRAGLNIKYVKNIATGGRLSLSYGFKRHHQNVESDPIPLRIINEEHVLADDQIVLLDKPFVDPSTVLVKDATGAIVYQLNFDYVLIERNEFLEIQRIPGGQIADNENIYIDYTATQVASYNYDADHETFSANISLFNRIIEFYFTTSNQDFKNTEFTDLLTLNKFNQNVYGSRIQFKFFRGGIEFDRYDSDIIPYRKKRYYVQLNGDIIKNLSVSLNGNINDYYFPETQTDQVIANIFGKVIYRINSHTKINFDAGYRSQTGRGIDLDLITARSEVLKIIRNLNMTLGFEMYRRVYVGNRVNFKGIYFQIERIF